jgi:Xaa-Pro aminopeptidase
MSLAPTATLARRHATVRTTLDALTLDALVVTNPSNIRYLSNHTGSAGVFVVTLSGVHLAVDFRYDAAVQALQASPAACPDLQIWPVPASYDEALIECLSAIGARTVGFEAAHLTVSRYDWLARTVGARGETFTLRPTERVVEQARIVKDTAEIDAVREAGRRLTGVAEATFRAVRPGVTERAVAAVLESAMRDAGYERLAFETIVASGPNAALPHYRAGDRRLAVGDLVVLDFGGVLDGYCCDLTRTVSVGPPSADAQRVYGAVLEAQQAAIAAVAPGVTTAAIDAAARDVLESYGLGEAFGHGTGHGLGIDIHEEPRVARQRPDVPAIPVEPGMIFTIEPGAYLPGWGGVRIEDDVLVTTDGCEVLTSVTRELLALGN